MKNKKKGLIIGIIVAVVLVVAVVGVGLIAGGIGFAFLHKPTIKLNDYVTIEATGYDGYGYASAYVDESKIKEDYGDKCKFSKKVKEEINDDSDDELLSMGLELAGIDLEDDDDAIELFCLLFCRETFLSEKNNLSNGDVITFSWGYSDEEETKTEINKIAKLLGVKVDYSDIKYTVEGLETVPQFDAFEGVELSFSGMEPNGQALIANYPENGLNYSIDKSNGLSNGDEITVTAEYPYGVDSYISMYEQVPSVMSKTYTIENLPAYITSASQISEDVLNEMKAQAEDVIQGSTYGWSSGYTLDVNYIGNYFLKAKDPTNSVQNSLMLVYKLHYQNSFKDYTGEYKDFGIDYYYYVRWENIYLDSDGKCKYDPNTYYKTTKEFKWNTGIYRKYSKALSCYLDEVVLTYTGYTSLEGIYDFFINQNVEYYKFEENIVE